MSKKAFGNFSQHVSNPDYSQFSYSRQGYIKKLERETPQAGFSNEGHPRCVSNCKFAVFGTF